MSCHVMPSQLRSARLSSSDSTSARLITSHLISLHPIFSRIVVVLAVALFFCFVPFRFFFLLRVVSYRNECHVMSKSAHKEADRYGLRDNIDLPKGNRSASQATPPSARHRMMYGRCPSSIRARTSPRSTASCEHMITV